MAAPHKSGQGNKYFVHELLKAWQGFLDEGVHLPKLLREHGASGNGQYGVPEDQVAHSCH